MKNFILKETRPVKTGFKIAVRPDLLPHYKLYIFDCCKQSLTQLLHPPIYPSTHPSTHPSTTVYFLHENRVFLGKNQALTYYSLLFCGFHPPTHPTTHPLQPTFCTKIKRSLTIAYFFAHKVSPLMHKLNYLI